ncbi:MAG TPA: tRNA guanosine(15) transglycosylase TgtA [Thermoplasmata archaeon]|nr:tRNA guanosine(15) transglycosylase TgtA [Thermoplasmata archaeon]
MIDFEIRARDGFARIGRFSTPHGVVDTPALLPVVHPDPRNQTIAPADIAKGFGLPAVITSSYITWRSPPLKERAEREGIHRLLGFSGPVFTDSGAFQQHAYGHVEVGPEEILEFQGRIGSDIAAVLDVFGEPDATPEEARRGVELTLERATRARDLRSGLLAVPVQGGLYPELRWTSAEGASALGDVLAVGGVVPLLEQYRFADLARVLLAARPALAPERAVHLFGTGHPITFAFAALFGVDLFDSAAYHKFARRGSLLFPEGTVALEDVREPFCGCRLCEERPLTTLGKLPAHDRETAIARHNLWMCATEVRRVRQAIRTGTLWELVERRAAAHPALLAGVRAAVKGSSVFLPVEPDSRPSFRQVTETSGERPAVVRFQERLARWRSTKGAYLEHPRVPLTPEHLGEIAVLGSDGNPLRWQVPTAVGPVPLELSEVYPVGVWVGPEEYEPPPAERPAASTGTQPPPPEPVDRSGRIAEWTRRQMSALLEWQYPGHALPLGESALRGIRSRNTGRLREFAYQHQPAFRVGNDGLPRPTWIGAGLLHAAVKAPGLRVIVQEEAVPFVREGRSLFSRFAGAVDPTIVPGASVLLVDRSDQLLAVGRAELAAHEMGRLSRGAAVIVTSHARNPVPEEPEPAPSAPPPEE